ncbi:ABC transporter permease [Streptomyces sp. B1866]|uniref:ABC transporter permease n=1 Tax=Streptomyces sp. B1866 TaxID=3075431 RepID=UPI0028922E9F|nr:ABC transporter permease [Streptomyces sp. B1866]MDT3398087.1 ABC transporter permease [Streptomyces sp. B1866]
MARHVIRRLLQMVPVLAGSTFLIFLMVYALGDPVAALFGDRAPDPATAARVRHDLYLDRPLWRQYAHYMSQVLRGDFGTSFTGDPVTALMRAAFPVTARLTLVAVVFESAAGIALGLAAGLRRGRGADTAVLLLTLVALAVPTFVSGTVLQYLLGVRWAWVSPTVAPEAPLGQLLLPGAVLGLVSVAYTTRLTRTSLAEHTRADYLRTAVAKGLPRRRIVTRHLLRNSLIPVVTFVGTDLGALLGGAVVTERIFNIHGVGYQLYQGILRHNAPTVVGFVTILVIVFLLANLAVDLLYALLDPRIRHV